MPSDSDLALDFAADYLEAVAAGGSVDLAAICAARADLIPQVESLLRDGGHLAEAAGKFALHADVDAEPMPDSLGRYQLMNVLGEGGMGIAFRGRDPELNRDVAVKLLRARVAHSPNSAKRFLDEARITAQLQHPTIPAVHELGTHPDGRPWMAMKLIKGDTLAALLATDSQSLNRLTVFESICQGLSYAHSKGVIHRDLKPQNIMVGAFGEVQVMDWGLAKVLGATSEPESASDETVGTVIASDRESDGEFTRAGTALGSPAYMPPEQAIGAVNRIDRRSDVFGLGAILCHLLTGKPPFVGADSESTRQLAAMGKVESAFARLDASGTDPEWVALCKRCLAAEAEQRPADAGAVAAEVAGLRADADERARTAELDKAKAEVRVEGERKRRRMIRVGVLIVGFTGALGISGTLIGLLQVAEEKRKRAEEKSTSAENALADERKRAAESYRNTARLEMQRGRWQFADEALRHAIELLPATTEIQIERARILLALNRIDESKSLLAEMTERTPSALLLEADLLLGVDGPRCKQLLAEASAHPDALSPADRAYAGGLLATSLASARSAFQQSLEHDRYHHRANVMLAWIELFALDKTIVPNHLRTARAYFPDDANLLVIESFTLAANGRTEAANALFLKSMPQLSKSDGSIAVVMSLLGELGDLEVAVTMPQPEFGVKIVKIAGSFGLKPQDEKPGHDVQSLTLPPFLSESLQPLSDKLGNRTPLEFAKLLPSLQSGELVKVIGQKKIDGAMYTLQAMPLFDGRFKEAHPLLIQALTTPSLMRHRRLTLTLLGLCEYRLSQKEFSGDGDPKWKAEAVKHLRELMMTEGGAPKYLPIPCIIAAKDCGDPQLALAMARDNLAKTPNEPWANAAFIVCHLWVGELAECLRLIEDARTKPFAKEIAANLDKNFGLAKEEIYKLYAKYPPPQQPSPVKPMK